MGNASDKLLLYVLKIEKGSEKDESKEDYLTFEGNGGKNSIEGTLSIGCDQNQVVPTIIYISYLQYYN